MARVLIVEDDPFIGLDLADQVADAGFDVVGVATDVAEAIGTLSAEGCDVAILDVNLGHETSEPIARQLIDEGIPFVVVSGYSKFQHPPVFADYPLVPKPIKIDLLLAELGNALA